MPPPLGKGILADAKESGMWLPLPHDSSVTWGILNTAGTGCHWVTATDRSARLSVTWRTVQTHRSLGLPKYCGVKTFDLAIKVLAHIAPQVNEIISSFL